MFDVEVAVVSMAFLGVLAVVVTWKVTWMSAYREGIRDSRAIWERTLDNAQERSMRLSGQATKNTLEEVWKFAHGGRTN